MSMYQSQLKPLGGTVALLICTLADLMQLRLFSFYSSGVFCFQAVLILPHLKVKATMEHKIVVFIKSYLYLE